MPLSIVSSHSVPITPRLVDTSARGIRDTENLQSANPPFPVLFADQVVVPSSGEQSFRSEAFTNNIGRPIELRGMRVELPVGSAAMIRTSAVISLEIEIDGVPVTRGAVPIWGMCRSDNRRNDGSVGVGFAQIGLNAWYFSQPVPLLPGRGIKVQAKHLGIGGPVTAYVAFAGRVSPKPIPNRVPFVAAWTSRSFAYAEVGVDSAPPDQIVNDTGRDLNIDRIIGRSLAYDSANGLNTELADFNDTSLQGVTSFLVRLGVGQSRPILKTYTMWRAVFGENAALETAFIMRPGDYLTADVAHVAGPVLGTPVTLSQNRGSLSIVGWREV